MSQTHVQRVKEVKADGLVLYLSALASWIQIAASWCLSMYTINARCSHVHAAQCTMPSQGRTDADEHAWYWARHVLHGEATSSRSGVENWSDSWRPSPDWDINTLGSCAPIAALYNTFKLGVWNWSSVSPIFPHLSPDAVCAMTMERNHNSQCFSILRTLLSRSCTDLRMKVKYLLLNSQEI